MEETKQTVPAGGKKKKPVVLIAVIAGLLALLLAIIAVIVIVVLVVAFAKPTVTLNDYVTIEATGYNGHGEADFYFDMEAFCEEYEGDVKFTSSFEEELGALGFAADGMPFDLSSEEDAALFFSMLCNASGTLSERQELSNGDVITFSWASPLAGDDIAHIEKMFGIKIKTEDITYTVSGLEDVVTFDPFEGFEITFDGVIGLTADYKMQAPYEMELEYGLVYVVNEDVSLLSNGDEVTVTVSHPGYTDEEYVDHYGKLPYPTEKNYTIEGLKTLITSPEMITDEMLAQLDQESKDYFVQQTVEQDWKEGFTADLHLVGYNFSVQDMREFHDWDMRNQIAMIYRVDYTLQFTDGAGNPQTYQTSYYYFLIWKYVIFDEEGKLTHGLEPSTPLYQIRFDSDQECYYPEYGMTFPLGLVFQGTYTLEEAIEQSKELASEVDVYVSCE